MIGYPSKKIEDFEYAAVGSSQVEFFNSGGEPYIFVYGSDLDHLRRIILRLNEWSVRESSTGFVISRGCRSHKIFIRRGVGESTLKITSYLWGWLPHKNHEGTVSSKGLELIIENLSRHT